jgi:hypothetical protein
MHSFIQIPLSFESIGFFPEHLRKEFKVCLNNVQTLVRKGSESIQMFEI